MYGFDANSVSFFKIGIVTLYGGKYTFLNGDIRKMSIKIAWHIGVNFRFKVATFPVI